MLICVVRITCLSAEMEEVNSSYWDLLSLDIQLYITSLAWRRCFNDFRQYLPIDLLCTEIPFHSYLSQSYADIGKIKYVHLRKLVINCPSNICTNQSWAYGEQCKGEHCTLNHSCIFLELSCGFKFFLRHTFEQALHGFPEDVYTLAAEHYKDAHGLKPLDE